MSGVNINIEQNVKKRIKKFIVNGQVVDGGAENYLGHNVGGIRGADQIPTEPKN